MSNFIALKRVCLYILIVLTIFSCKKEEKMPDLAMPIVEQKSEPKLMFGYNLDEYDVVNDTVKSGDSFGKILLDSHVDYPRIDQIATQIKDSFDVRRINIGKPYTILKSKDSLNKAQVFIYQKNKIEHLVVDFKDSILASNKRKPVKIVPKIASGVILSSLSQAIDDQGLDYAIANDMSDIYAWTIDFFRLQKGDRFKVFYNERYIDDTIYAGIEGIKAAHFEHNKESFYSFEFETDSVNMIRDYFDENAKNLRRAFLKAPLRFKSVRITSRYNLRRRIALYGNKIRPHRGTDFAAPIGTPIISTANGTVLESARRGGNGNYVKVKHNGTYTTQYLHMKKRKVKVGEYVKQGDVIGWVGMTGNTSGPHVCYRFWKNGVQVDPFKQKLPEAEPIKLELKEKYLEYIKPLKAKLDSIPFQEVKDIDANNGELDI
ncbi:MAG: peptidoglycan DD-metalloendopeptidase family protein [Flavobacteriaceae bacterium]|nr:peptidoglycan DD-metalloendopeptidase family protein [Flavobacteriaceae bacterium]